MRHPLAVLAVSWNVVPTIGKLWLRRKQVQVACKSVQLALENCSGPRYSARHSASMPPPPIAYERRGSMCPRCPDRRATRTAYHMAHNLVMESYRCNDCGYAWDIFRTTAGMPSATASAEPDSPAQKAEAPASDAV